MRAFRFRLAPLQRVKRHKVEEKEREIARLEAEIQRRLGEIDEGRRRLAEFRRIFLEETPEIHSIEVEYTEMAIRAYILSVEVATYQAIDKLRKEQEARHKELIALYQEEKMLERLKDRQLAAWQQEAQREEIYLLDEMGGQAHLRRQREPAGGALLIVLGTVALLAAAGATLVMLGKHKPILEKHRPFLESVGLMKPPAPEVAPAEVRAATTTPGEYTIRDLYGDPDRPAREVLSNLADRSKRIQARERDLDEEKARVKAEREALTQSGKQLEDKLIDLQAQLAKLEKAQQDEQARLTTQYMTRVTEISNAIQRMNPKGAAELLAEMWKIPVATDPDAKNIALEVFRAVPATKRNKVLDALVKTNKAETADMILKFIQLEPSGTPTSVPAP